MKNFKTLQNAVMLSVMAGSLMSLLITHLLLKIYKNLLWTILSLLQAAPKPRLLIPL